MYVISRLYNIIVDFVGLLYYKNVRKSTKWLYFYKLGRYVDNNINTVISSVITS